MAHRNARLAVHPALDRRPQQHECCRGVVRQSPPRRRHAAASSSDTVESASVAPAAAFERLPRRGSMPAGLPRHRTRDRGENGG